MKLPSARTVRIFLWGGVFFLALALAGAYWASQRAAAQACPIGQMMVSGNNGQSVCGPVVPATWNFSSPASRSLSLATAYQCTNPAMPCVMTINLSSTANISLSGGTTNSADGLVGSTTGVATGTGSIQCRHTNSNTGTLTIGLNLSTIATSQCTLPIPIGYYFAVRQTTGTVSIVNAFENTAG